MTRPAHNTWSICDGRMDSPLEMWQYRRAQPVREANIGCLSVPRLSHGNALLTATTVMKSSHTPLSVWFWGAYLVRTRTLEQFAL